MPFESISLTTLRQDLARRVGDLLAIGTATAGAAGTLTDTKNLLFDSADQLIGTWAYLTGGTGSGLGDDSERYITASTVAGQISISPNWTTAPDTTTTYEIHRRYRIRDYHSAIKSALRATRIHFMTRSRDDTLTAESSKREYTLPKNIHSVHAVAYITSADPDNPEVELPISDITLDRDNNLLRFENDRPPDNATIVIHGLFFPAIPTEETDILGINSEPIILYAAGVLADMNSDNRGLAWKRDAASLLPDLAIPYPPNSIIIEPN